MCLQGAGIEGGSHLFFPVDESASKLSEKEGLSLEYYLRKLIEAEMNNSQFIP